MERSASDPLQCPRCNSSNTKFCYYNNYNLSQPRHFCKACKRYWTRGGTLRNVPVGGGCRKNKKFKRHPPSNGGGGGDEFPAIMKAPSSLQPNVDLSPPSSNHVINNNPFFSSFPTELNFPFSVTRVSSDSPRFDDLLPRIVGPGLGFSPDYRNPVFDQNSRDHANSLLAQHQRFAASSEIPFPFPSLTPYEGMHMAVGNREIGKEPEIRSGQIHEQINYSSSSSSSSFLWNSNNIGVWFDPSSSVPPLI